jgi:type IV pilus assembly protein PilY1
MRFKSTLFALSTALIPTSYANLDLADVPLFTTTNAPPNVFLLLNDAGSMDSEFLLGKYWHFCAYDPLATGSHSNSVCGWLIEDGIYRGYGNDKFRFFSWIFDNQDNILAPTCDNNRENTIQKCPQAATKDWRIHSADLNFIYYHPSIEYLPWQGPCALDGSACVAANFSDARSNPSEDSEGYSLKRNLAGLSYEIWIDDKGYDTKDDRPHRSKKLNVTNTPNNEVDLWDSHVQVEVNATNAAISSIVYAPTEQSMNPTVTLEATLDDGNACYNALGAPDLVRKIFAGQLSYTSTGASSCRTLAQAQANIANWYQYYRKRAFVAKAGISEVMHAYPRFRYGMATTNYATTDFFIEMPEAQTTDFSQHNHDLLSSLYRYPWPNLGAPLRRGLQDVGRYFADELNQSTPIIYACQQNFSLLMTDGFWDGPSPGVGDQDGDKITNTVADVARYYYLTDLSPLPNTVPPNPFDPATYQHLVTFTFSFGRQGYLQDTDGNGWPNPALSESDVWGANPNNDFSAKIDDLWHAAFNSKGTYTSQTRPQALVDRLHFALANIQNRIGSAATVGQSATTLQNNAQVFQARFDTQHWRGELLAYPITINGVASTPDWNAHCLLTGGECFLPVISAQDNPAHDPDTRVILTALHNEGRPFIWPTDYSSLKVDGQLPTTIARYLAFAPFDANTTVDSEISANQAYGEKLTDYLRGHRSQEQDQGGPFRTRSGILGDIVHSNPVYVGPPARFFANDSSYTDFKNQYADRTPVVYVGANDGMLHGFEASSGKELLAYIPEHRTIYQHLPHYSQPHYLHRYFVDGSPVEADVYLNGQWSTVLISNMGKGAQGIFGLNITDPSQFQNQNAQNIHQWQFSDEDDADLGYVYGQVAIAQVKSGDNSSQWVAIVGNGYNNTEEDGFVSSTGQAALFILSLGDGLNDQWESNSNYIKLPVGPSNTTRPNGLGAPYPVDIDGDQIVDYIYAGDLNGNIWKFDVRDPDPRNWKHSITQLFTALQTEVGDQPITAPPIVGAHPNGLSEGVMVYFGTGKYLESSDNETNNAITQTFYGIWDKLDGTVVKKADLLQQDILSQISQDFDSNGDGVKDNTVQARVVSDHPIDWQQHLGWRLDLKALNVDSNQGERQISRPLLRNGTLIFTTLLPSEEPCEIAEGSWIMEIDAANGGRLAVSPFDFNQNGQFDESDYVTFTNELGETQTVPASGKKSEVGITPTPAVLMSDDKGKELKVISGSKGISSFTENSAGPQGRQTWRQLD